MGELVLMRVPGLHGALESSWEGPYSVVRVVSRVTYFVKRDGGGHKRLVHLNNLKVHRPRPASVASVCVVAEETGVMEAALQKETVLGEDNCVGCSQCELDVLLKVCDDMFSEQPGLCTECECKIELKPETVSLPPYQISRSLVDKVKLEATRMIENKVICESESEWCAPVVPVCKPDVTVKICLNYMKLNKQIPLNLYYLFKPNELVERVKGSGLLSIIDLTSSFPPNTIKREQ